jgi:hypothetical protein
MKPIETSFIVLYKERFIYLFIGKLHTHLVGLEPTTSSSSLLQREEVPFELKLIGKERYNKSTNMLLSQTRLGRETLRESNMVKLIYILRHHL